VNLAGLILAGGASRRMGAPKALLELHGETFLDRLIAVLWGACSPVLVVLGHNADVIRAGVRRASEATFVINPDYSRGQLSSLQCGLAAVPAEAGGVIFTPVDYPGVRSSTVAEIASRFHGRTKNELFVIPRSAGRRGHPVCCAREVIPEFLALPADAQAREVVHRHRERTCYVDVEDSGILEDADDPEAYQRLLKASHQP
jgi:molybdenum cofactor cytidylyltransferase